MQTTKICMYCGRTYLFDPKNKKGNSTNACNSCIKKRSAIKDHLDAIEAAGKACICCGYDKCDEAMEFYDPVARINPDPMPKDTKKRIEWASKRYLLCLNCIAEIGAGIMKIYKTQKPIFYKDENDLLTQLGYTPVEITTDEPRITH